MKDFIDQGLMWPLIKIIGIVAVIVSSVISFVAYALKDYFLNRWKSDQEKEIALLKSKADHNSNLINNLTGSISETYLASSDKRLGSFETLWSSLVDIRQNIPHLVFTCYTLLSKAELQNLASVWNQHLEKQVATFKPDDYYDLLSTQKHKVDKLRPFIGDELWKIFSVYSGFFGRLTYLVQTGLPHNKIVHWTEDLPFQGQMLGYIIEPEALKQLMSHEMKGLHDVSNYLEYKALNEISEQITGKRFTEETIKQAISLSEFLQASKEGLTPSA